MYPLNVPEGIANSIGIDASCSNAESKQGKDCHGLATLADDREYEPWAIHRH